MQRIKYNFILGAIKLSRLKLDIPLCYHTYYLIYKDEMVFCSFLFVCLFVPYTNPHSWTDLSQTLHTSSLGLEETVGHVWSENVWPCLPFWHFSSGASAESSARNGCRRKLSATALYPWFLLLLVWRHGNDVVADDSFASCISHPRQRYIRDSCLC